MDILLKGGRVFYNGSFSVLDILVKDGIISGLYPSGKDFEGQVFNCKGFHIFPGFADVHVHLREPGFSYKETISSGTQAAARGGYTALGAMPNLAPPPSNLDGLIQQMQIIENWANVDVVPYGCITKNQSGRGELCNFSTLAPHVLAFSDDGKGVQDEALMKSAMEKIKMENAILAAHCEDEDELFGGYIHDGEYAKTHGHKGISSFSEYGQLERDLRLVNQTGCRYHMCHLSTRESLDLVFEAKLNGLPVTCETAPHYLIFSDENLQEDGRFKMNPPLRSKADKEALIRGIKDGTIDIIATDHAPHSKDEKAKGLEGSSFGVVGLETAFAALYTHLVKPGIITLEKLIHLMAIKPREIFQKLPPSAIEKGSVANLSVWDLEEEYVIDSAGFLSMGRSTPFDGMAVFGKNKMTLAGGEIVWLE